MVHVMAPTRSSKKTTSCPGLPGGPGSSLDLRATPLRFCCIPINCLYSGPCDVEALSDNHTSILGDFASSLVSVNSCRLSMASTKPSSGLPRFPHGSLLLPSIRPADGSPLSSGRHSDGNTLPHGEMQAHSWHLGVRPALDPAGLLPGLNSLKTGKITEARDGESGRIRFYSYSLATLAFAFGPLHGKRGPGYPSISRIVLAAGANPRSLS